MQHTHVINRKTMIVTDYDGFIRIGPANNARHLEPEWLENETAEGVRTYRVQSTNGKSYRLIVKARNVKVAATDYLPQLGGL